LTFARLLEIVAMRVCSASSPVFAIHSAGYMRVSSFRRGALLPA
jgi:hypothetical protein